MTVAVMILAIGVELLPKQRRQNLCARADCVQLGERRRAGRVHRGEMLDGGV